MSMLSLLELSTPFETGDHRIPVTRSRATYSCSCMILDWFISYFSFAPRLFVGHESIPSVLKSGVPQGSVLESLLFTLYTRTQPLSTVRQSGLSHFFFTNDSWLHNSSILSDYPALAFCLEDCIEDVVEWMGDSKLKMNDDHTEIIALCTRLNISQVIPNCNPKSISGYDMPFSQSVKNPGFYLVETLSMDAHIKHFCHSLWVRLP